MEDAAHDVSADHGDRGQADTLGSIGEEAVLQRIFPLLPFSDSQIVGPGDDAAVVRAPDARFVVTTDMMVHGPDFRWEWSSPHDIGWKAAASNLSDVAAMGAKPSSLLVAIAAPAETPVATLEGIARGFADACAALAPACGVVGGDLSVSPVFTLAVTAFGDLEGRAPVLRSDARAGDVIAISGEIGLAGRGLELLFEHAVDATGAPDRARAQSLRESHKNAIAAQLAPRPPISDGVHAALAGARAMIDVSDGLALDARRLARASGVGIDFDSRALEAASGLDVLAALRGGEDHSLLACFSADAALPGGFRAIGRVVAAEGIHIDGRPIDSAGWDPYRGWDGRF